MPEKYYLRMMDLRKSESKVRFSTPYLIPIAKDGSIKTNEICNPDLKGLKSEKAHF